MTHLVNSLQLEVTCPDEGQAFDVRSNFSQTFQAEVTEIADEIFSKYVGENESLKIDKLELDLGSFSSYTFNFDFKRALRAKLEYELTKQLSEIAPAQKQLSLQLTNAQTVQYFLLNGSLPWWADETDMDIDALCADLFVSQANTFRHFFYQNRLKDKLWQRVLWQLNGASKKLVIGLSVTLKSVGEEFETWIARLAGKISEANGAEFKENFANTDDAVIRNAYSIFADPDDEELYEKIFKLHINEVFKSNAAVLKQVTDEMTVIIAEIENAGAPPLPPGQGNDTGDGETSSEILTIEDSTEKYSVKYAGVVLLAPFLKTFFAELGLLKDEKWIDIDAACKGVHLLKFLSTGQQKVPEYSMVLEKILCGLPVFTPVPLDIVLEDKEVTEATTLLSAVIQHWEALKNTSVDGLRENFLKRDGLLSKKDGGWLLQIEQKTLDVLLDMLPWGYSTISLPWNDYLVYVEW